MTLVAQGLIVSYRLRLLYQVSFWLHVGRPEFCDNTST